MNASPGTVRSATASAKGRSRSSRSFARAREGALLRGVPRPVPRARRPAVRSAPRGRRASKFRAIRREARRALRAVWPRLRRESDARPRAAADRRSTRGVPPWPRGRRHARAVAASTRETCALDCASSDGARGGSSPGFCSRASPSHAATKTSCATSSLAATSPTMASEIVATRRRWSQIELFRPRFGLRAPLRRPSRGDPCTRPAPASAISSSTEAGDGEFRAKLGSVYS